MTMPVPLRTEPSRWLRLALPGLALLGLLLPSYRDISLGLWQGVSSFSVQ